jgi:multidrug resistance efflux pump
MYDWKLNMTSYPRLSRVLLVTGVAVLLTSAVSATWALQQPDRAPDHASVSASASGVVALGHVDLEHGVASLYPIQPGRVAEVLVHENDRVEAGAPLLRLDDTQARLQLAEAKVALETAQAQLTDARKAPEQHAAKLDQQRATIEAAEQRLAASRTLLGRKRQLAKLNQISPEDVTAAEDQVNELQAAAHAEAAKLRELQLHDPAVDVRRSELNVAAMRAKHDQAQHALDECTLKAPEAGSVLRILVAPGDVLSAQTKQTAILFAPNGPRLVRAELDQEFAGRVREGQSAVIEDDAPSGQRWTGRVLRVADWYHSRRTILKEPAPPLDVRTVECLIEFDSGQTQPRLGQRVRVTIGGNAS